METVFTFFSKITAIIFSNFFQVLEVVYYHLFITTCCENCYWTFNQGCHLNDFSLDLVIFDVA